MGWDGWFCGGFWSRLGVGILLRGIDRHPIVGDRRRDPDRCRDLLLLKNVSRQPVRCGGRGRKGVRDENHPAQTEAAVSEYRSPGAREAKRHVGSADWEITRSSRWPDDRLAWGWFAPCRQFVPPGRCPIYRFSFFEIPNMRRRGGLLYWALLVSSERVRRTNDF